jgi:RNA polymerase sigma-70 factor, ECF subfamily
MTTLLPVLDEPRTAGYTAIHGRGTVARRVDMTILADDGLARSDEALARRLRMRDVRALEELYDRYSRALFSLAVKLLADHESAEEVVQETFLKLWQRPDSYVAERGRLVSWLMGVAHHRAVDRLRRRRLELRYSTDHRVVDLGAAPPDPEHELLTTLRGEAVTRAVRTLPEAQRVVVELAYVRGMTQVEIAQALGEPLGTVKTRLRLAMQKLRASLELAEMRPGSS